MCDNERCDSDQIVSIGAKCSDMCNVKWPSGKEVYDEGAPCEINIGGGDYVEFEMCLECGKVQGTFPVAEPKDPEDDHYETLSLRFLLDRCEWDDICEATGMNEWARNEGQVTDESQIDLSYKQARKLGVM